MLTMPIPGLTARVKAIFTLPIDAPPNGMPMTHKNGAQKGSLWPGLRWYAVPSNIPPLFVNDEKLADRKLRGGWKRKSILIRLHKR